MEAKVKYFKQLLHKTSERVILYFVVILILLNGVLMLYSRELNRELILLTKLADRLLFEVKLPHDFSIRDADIALRGYAIAGEERFLFATIPRVRIEIEKSFSLLDSILSAQGFNSTAGREKIEKYKYQIRQFNDHQYELVKLVREGKTELFLEKFKFDAGSHLYPAFVDAVEEVNAFELMKIHRQEGLAYLAAAISFWLQVVTLILVAPLLVYVSIRISKQREQDKIAEELRVKAHINSTKEEVLSILSHEIRTPLNSVIGLTHVLSKRAPRQDQQEVIQTLEASADHLLHIVNDILDFNKIQAKGISLEVLPLDLSTLLRQVHSMFIRIAEDRNLDFTVQLDSSIPGRLLGDPTRLVQILSNLASNGLKFTLTGGVHLNAQLIRAEEFEAEVEFIVKDTGVGIDPSEIENIFLPFKQEKNIHGKFGGTGLGLSIVKNLCELMGGEISVSSTKGQGTTFTVRIPFKLQPNNNQNSDDNLGSEAIANSAVLKGTKILYVEDVESNWFLVNSILESYGVTCENSVDGANTLKQVCNNKYDLILLDVQLPDMNGFDVARFIRNDSNSKNKGTPIILFSAFANIAEQEIIDCGANDLLGKPFKPENLIQKMGALMGQPKLTKE